MARNTQRGQRVKTYLAQSNWVTDSWSWLMVLAGKAAEPILILSVLYSSAKLLPALQPYLTAQFDAVVFIAQFIALDVGGLSLNKMADQVQVTNPRGAQIAKRLSIALVSIMIAGVIMATLSAPLSHLPVFSNVVDTLLLIARAILAVLYSRVIHSLKGHDEDGPGAPVGGPDGWAMAGLAAFLQQLFQRQMDHHQADQDTKLQALRAEMQALIQAEVQAVTRQVQATLQANVPEVQAAGIDLQALVQATADFLVPQFQARLQAVDQAMTRQQTTIREIADQVKRLPEKAATKQGCPAAQPSHAPIPLAPEQASREVLLKRALQLQATGMSTYKIAETLQKPAKTVQSWLSKSDNVQAISGNDQAINE